jgi:uncharacterized membrane-anchored protein
VIFRILKLIIFIAIIWYVSNFIANTEGTTTINWIGWGIELPTDRLIFILIIFAALLIFVDRILIFIFNIPKLAFRRLEAKKNQKVEHKLVKAFLLASHGEFVLAAKEAALISQNTKDRKLGKLLKEHLDVVNNINFESENKKEISQNYFKSLADDPTTAFVGHLALMRQAILNKADLTDIIYEAEQALKFETESKQILEILLFSYAKIDDVTNSLKHLKTIKNLKYLDDLTFKNIAADLNYLSALKSIEHSNNKTAINFLKEAMKLNPGHILASIKLSNMITGIGSLSKAITFLEKTFLITAHPDLLLELSEKWNLKTSGSKVSRAISMLNKKTSAKIKNDLKIEIASYAVSKEIWGEASKLLSDIPEEKLTNKAYQVLADISGSQNNAEKVKYYLEKAANAIQGNHYHCSSCGIKNDKWELHCPKCETLSSIRWMSISDVEITNSLSLSNSFSSLNKNLIDKKN